MKKFLTLICTVVVTGYLITNPIFTYYAEAVSVSDGSAEIPGQMTGEETPLPAAELTDEVAALVGEARNALKEITRERDVMALVYLSDYYPIRADSSYDSETVVTVPSGQQVLIQDIALDENYEVWEYVTLLYQDKQYSGYIPRSYLACSDELFLNWEDTYGMNPAARQVMTVDASGRTVYPDVAQFPESYQASLTALKQAHPNWTFVVMNTNLDWGTVVYNELVKRGRSLIPSSFPAYMQTENYSKGWAIPTQNTLEYYLDPRNWLGENTVFQFELLTYNASYHTEEALTKFLDNTFMKSSVLVPGTVLNYPHTFWAIGREKNVSPFHLACRVYQEQGAGNSPLISGNYPGFQGYYNFFNIGASGVTDEEVYRNGLTYAKNKGWTDGYYSILGGTMVISENYISQGQDTLYLQKFDVDPSYNGMFSHQYMQNICAPSSEGQNVRKLYAGANSLDNTFVFKIPVYNNMPASCPKPTASYTVGVTPPEGYTDTIIYLDGIAYQGISQSGQLLVNAPGGGCKTAVMYKYNESGVPIGMYVWSLSHNGSAYTVTAVPELQDLLTYHGFSIRIVGKSGIRFKTGVDTGLRSRLLNEGAAGYHLKEYGTLVMNKANMAQYPMVKDGQKVLSGRSYGYNESGQLEDKIYETVSGRYRFTSVLVGLPATQYKIEYAFRGYAVLNRDGQDVIVYGPPVAKSIYALAQQVLANGQYAAGSEADIFLRQLISDADAVVAQ